MPIALDTKRLKAPDLAASSHSRLR